MTRRSIALVATLGAALVLHAGAAVADQGTYEVSADNVYVRPKPQSWVIGTLFGSGPNVSGREHIDVQEVTPGGWAYGFVYGSFQGCGWVAVGSIRKVNDSVSKHCATDDGTRMPGPESMFSDWTDPDQPNGRQYHTVDCAPAGATARGAYGNYRRGEFANRYGALPANHPVDWRYTTKDGAAAMVKDTSNGVGAPPWFFVPAACIARGNPPAATPAPPASGTPPATQPATPPTPSTGPGGQGPASRPVCWKTSRSGYCKRVRRACRRTRSHTPRCRRALTGTRRR